MFRQFSTATLAGAFSITLLNSTCAFAAQDQDSAAAPIVEDEIIVTAQRREQSLQQVPIAITALAADTLSSGGVSAVSDLDQMTPGLVSTTSAGAPQRYLRGVGAQTVALYEQPVATYVDGVYIASSSGSVFSFNNIERVEVLRGPQGTLFGRNATGGVIQVVTKKPSDDPELRAKAAYSSYETVELNAYGSNRISNGVAASIAFYLRNQGKGYGTNLFTGKRVNSEDDVALRGQLLIEPTSNFSLRYAGDYVEQESDFGLARYVIPGARNALGATRVGGFQDVNYNYDATGKNSQWGVSQDALLTLDTISIRSITAYRKYKYFADYDTDVTTSNILNATRHENGKTFQQEFLAFGSAGQLDWTAGLFYFSMDSIQDPVATFGANAAGNFDRFSVASVKSYAAYLQGTYRVTDKLSLTAGGRYTIDKAKFNGEFISRPGFPGGAGQILQVAIDRSFETKKPTWRFALDYQATPNLLAYGSVSRGFRSGSFNNGSLTQDPTRPEVLDAYELGLKSELFDRVVRFNIAAFKYDYKDLQLNSVNLPAILILNAASAKIKGAEIEMRVAPRISTGSLNFGGAVTLLDAKYGDFPNAQYYLPNPFTAPPAGLTCATAFSGAPGGNTNCTFNASGNRMIRSPKWTLNLNVDYSVPVSFGELGFHANYYHNDGFYWETSNRVRQAPYDIINGDISLKLESGVELSVFAKNITNEKYYSSVNESGVGDVATPQAPRIYGVSLEYRFGS
ncbi:TonB-dependent receptor [Novosphingobium sp. 9U]|uniref:TonB-dependent receptor n=1 Tax=Novosphingobium sp. 9U TaxID=2653158 RepID=UPI0012EFC0C8|nr:TonB-dependent receptor [Novosphingobium sp. 9U]VWX50606.1 putative TonB-dependent receptor [Novosphingobium sp. 9U]